MTLVDSTVAGIGDYYQAGTSSDAGPNAAPPPKPKPDPPPRPNPDPGPWPNPDPAVRPAPASSLPGCGGKQTLTSEVLWAMHCVESQYLFRLCQGIVDLFQLMFPGHPVAETFSCGGTKCRYFCQFGHAQSNFS